ncbi:MAG: hypothetical protein MAGBODY4_01202 [Candidatus Marinimicrobia bacterium]|nr:hypothetical protein [Candidatus Neomarinimicrobiota bacterium]
MIRNAILFILLVVMSVGFWIQAKGIYGDKPDDFLDAQEELEELNEQLITAQILSKKLDRVYTLFERNLALSKRDSLAEDASLPFLNTLTQMLENLDIQLLSLEPKPRSEQGEYIEAPYQITIQCTFERFGKLVAELEKSPRLIDIEEFSLRNPVERIRRARTAEDLNTPTIEMQITTITLVKNAARRM